MSEPDAPRALPRPILPLWLAVPAAAVAGGLMDLAFPAAGVWPSAFVAIALLLVALIGRRAGGALLVGVVYGAVLFALLVSWTSRYLGPLPWIALTALEAVLTAALLIGITLAYRWVPRVLPSTGGRLLALPAVIAALWVGREVIVGTVPYGGFPWARVGMTQSESPLATITSWLGVGGLGFLMVFTVAVIIECVRLRVWRRPALVALPAGLVAVLLLVPVFPTTVSGSMRIAAVQGNGPTGYFDEREPYAVLQAQSDATEPLIGEDLDLVVWPEGGLDYDPFQSENTARRLDYLSFRLDASILANAATERDGEYFNTSMLWGTDDDVVQKHDKRHPVPFGEYIPDRAFYRLFVPHLVDLVQREYTPGTNPPLMSVGEAVVGLAICFDVIYDDVITEGIRGGAEVLVFQTNNADFRGTDENLQQLAFARMRAIETGRWVVNVSTVGTSQIIRSDGTTVSSLDADQAGALLDQVERRTGLTAGVVLGPTVQLTLLWGGLGAVALSGVLGRRRAQAPIFSRDSP